MKITRLLSAFALLVLLSFGIFAQAPTTGSATESKEEKEKARAELEKKAVALAGQTADEAALLKLPENRSLAFATAADLIWTRDEKRARRLFQEAAEQLIQANAEMEKGEGEMPFMAFQSTQPRGQILQMVARRDADLALELLIQTRSAKLAAEMQKAAAESIASQPASADEPKQMAGWESKFLVQNEQRLEQSFAALAAENSPAKAIKMIRESLSKNGVTFEVFRLLQKLNEKDEEAAKSLLGDVVAKLLSADLNSKENERRAANSFLTQFAIQRPSEAETEKNKKRLKPDEKMLKDVANKIIDSFLAAKNFTALFEINYIMPTLEKLAPERAAQIRQKQAALRKTAPNEGLEDMEAMNAINRPDATPEDIIRGAARVPPNMRRYAYERAVRQLADKGEYDRARQLLNEAPAGAERDKALALLDSKMAEKAVKENKFDEARKIIAKITDKNAQIEQLVSMARAYQAKNTKEDHETAVKLMDEARRMIDDTPQNEEEINALLAVVAGYAAIEPDRAFTMLEPLVDQSNELLQAAALLAKYNKRERRFRNGELTFAQGASQMRSSAMRYRREIGLLAAHNFERTRGLTDKFQRQDAQIFARLMLAQSILQGGQKDAGTQVIEPGIVFEFE